MSFFSQRVDVFGVAAFPGTPQVTIPFEPKRIQFVNEDTTDDAFVSFDGSTEDLRLVPGSPVTLEQRGLKRIWLKRGAVGTTPTEIQIIVES